MIAERVKRDSVVRLIEHPRFLLVSFIVFCSLRLALVFVPMPPPASDAGWYLARAITLNEQGTYSEGSVMTAYWPIGYPAFVAAIFKVTGTSLLAARIGNLALAMASFWLYYQIVQKIFRDELVARGSLLLLTVYPNNAAYVPLLLAECLYAFLLLAATLALLSNRLLVRTLMAGIMFGLATLVKTQTILLVPVLGLLPLMRHWSWKQLFVGGIQVAVIVIVALAVVSPWTFRNYRVFGTLIPVSTNGGMSLLVANNPSAASDYTSSYSEADSLVAEARFSVKDQVEADKRANALAIKWITENPEQFLRMIPKKIFWLWGPDGEAEWGYQDSVFYQNHWKWFRLVRVINQLFYFTLLSLFTVAVWKLAAVRSRPVMWYAVAIAALFTVLCIMFSGQSRYHYPAMPFIISYAAWVLLGHDGVRRPRTVRGAQFHGSHRI